MASEPRLRTGIGSRRGVGAVALGLVLVAVAVLCSGAASAAPTTVAQQTARINGTGSTYVGLAMQQWTSEGQSLGLQVNYTPTGSPDGLSRYSGGQVDFAGTEAEFSSLGQGGTVSRGFQYVPDVAGAIAVMYNVVDLSGRKVDYLHLSRSTVAKIFIGEITHWDDTQIAADNAAANLRLPHEPINVVYRSGESGTTALFYDFVREMEPGLFSAWAGRNRINEGVRIIALDSSPGFAPKTQALNGSDQIAQYVAGDAGRWSIAYDEFGYAKVYGAAAAWVENQQGRWVLPYAENISAALETAALRPDLSQELKDVYRSPNPLAYPISAYSYMVTQCVPGGDRPSCSGPYPNAGVTATLTQWMRYIACEGQVRMAQLGYSPLPPGLSQEMANSIARLEGVAPETLNAGNCANPRFSGSLGAGATSPPDPYLGLAGFPGNPGPNDGAGGGPTGGASGGPTDPNAPAGPSGATTGSGSTAAANGPTAGPGGIIANGPTGAGSEVLAASSTGAGRSGSGLAAVGGGSSDWRNPEPVVYARLPTDASRWPVVVLIGVLLIPVAAVSATSWVRRRRSRAS